MIWTTDTGEGCFVGEGVGDKVVGESEVGESDVGFFEVGEYDVGDKLVGCVDGDKDVGD